VHINLKQTTRNFHKPGHRFVNINPGLPTVLHKSLDLRLSGLDWSLAPLAFLFRLLSFIMIYPLTLCFVLCFGLPLSPGCHTGRAIYSVWYVTIHFSYLSSLFLYSFFIFLASTVIVLPARLHSWQFRAVRQAFTFCV
jgi:hypothetical protein